MAASARVATPEDPPEPTAHLSAATPPGWIYSDEGRFREELERLWFPNWLVLGREEEIPQSGDFLTREIGGESVLLVRGSDGKVRGFYNVCRHRGTRLLNEEQGSGLKHVVCPYHAWNYSLDGRVVGAPDTKDLRDFDRSKYGLHPIEVDRWGGFLWGRLEPGGPSLHETFGDLFRRFEAVDVGRMRRGAHIRYDIQANWKILVENYSECYHCAPVHPDLNRITPFNTGGNDAYFISNGKRSMFNGGYQTFAKDYTSMTWSGYTSRPLIQGLSAAQQKRISYYVLFPNTFFSMHPDYLMMHRTFPLSPGRSFIENDFYFEPETMARADFDPSDATKIWDKINREDWAVCEGAQRGTRSRIWSGGRYAGQETLTHDFDAFVEDQMRPRRSRAVRKSSSRRRSHHR